MHPAVSVIFFTVTSGAGFGFMALLGLGIPMPAGGLGAFVACVIAGGLAVAGLIASTFHLGHPERAWRAFSQWQSSWLSREGVCAVATLILFGIYGIFWVFFNTRIELLGLLMSVGAIATVFTTSMIYTQLKTVPSWNTSLTPICYLLFAITCGIFLSASFGVWEISILPFLSFCSLAVAWGAKILWWQNSENDTLAKRGSDTGTATGLGNIGTVKLLEKPHSGENYLTKEMVHKVGRKHAHKLKRIALLMGAGIPLLMCVLAMLFGNLGGLYAIALISLLAGLFAERWLFFAQAKHAVSLYY